MNVLKRFRLGIESLLHPSKLAGEIDREIQYHIEMRTEDLARRGASPDEARRQALREFGPVDRARESWLDVRAFGWLESLLQDVRFGARMIRRSPGSAAVAALTLALGIGLNASIFSAVDAVLLRPLPYRFGSRLLRIGEPAEGATVDESLLSPPEVRDLTLESRTLDGVAEYHSMAFNLLGHGRPRRVRTGVVSANYFDLLGVRAARGRTFRPGEDRPGAPPVLLLSHAFWQSALGGDPTVVGQMFEMNDRVHTVVGILPPLPTYPDDNDVYMPISSCPFRSAESWNSNRAGRGLTVFGRRRPEATLAAVQRDLAAISARWKRAYPEAYPAGVRIRLAAVSLREELRRNARLTLLLLFSTAGLVLLIGLANVANLILARVSRRRSEFAVRSALGAGRRRIVRQLVTESTMIALAGGAAGLGLAAAVRSALTVFAARFSPSADGIAIDGRVLIFTLVLSVVTGIAVGCVPALHESRNLAEDLRDTGEARPHGRTAGSTRTILVVAQVSISLLLLVGAGLLVRSLMALNRVPSGFEEENVLTARVSLDWTKYATPEASVRYYHRLLEAISRDPGVRSAAVASAFPLSGATPWNLDFRVEGRDPDSGAPRVDLQIVSADYFRTIGAPLKAGRPFSDQDRPDGEPVAIVSSATARRFWPGASPIGRRINIGGNPIRWRTVVGVAVDVKQYGLDKAPGDEVYVPYRQFGGSQMRLLVRSVRPPDFLRSEIERLVGGLDPTTPVGEFHTLKKIRRDSLASPRITTVLLALFAVLALTISAAGVGAVTAISVSQRTREIGIRMALGATRVDILGMVIRRSLVPVAAGIAVGLVGATALTRSISALLFGVAPLDPLTFVLVSVVLAGTATAACLVPGRRAARIDPLAAFRAL